MLKTIAKRLAATAGVLVIALALVIGAVRLLLAQLPGYQDELRAWVAAELGVEPAFAVLDARLGLFGPELHLRDVSLRTVGATRDFLDAAAASVTLDPFALLLSRRVSISRLTLDGVSLGIERTDDGAMRVQGLTAAAGSSDVDLESVLPESIEVVIRNSQLLYTDRIEQLSWQFRALDIVFERGPVELIAQAQAEPPEDVAETIAVDARRSSGSGRTELDVHLVGAKLAAVSQMMPDARLKGFTGNGDVAFRGVWLAGRIVEALADVALVDVGLTPEARIDYDRLAFGARWARSGTGGFALTLDGLNVSRGGRSWPADGTVMLSATAGADVIGATADFIRLEDLGPIVERLAPTALTARWAGLSPRGDLERLEFRTDDAGRQRDYTFEAGFSGLGLAPQAGWPGFAGLDGDVRAGDAAGTISFSGGDVSIRWPRMFAATLAGDGLRGTVVWRRGQDGLRVLSDDLGIRLFGEPLVASFEYAVPASGAGSYLDLHGRLDRISITEAKALLPLDGLPDSVSSWVNAALLGGTGENVSFELTGSLADFPFDTGTGRFLVEADVTGAEIAFIDEWPPARNLNGRIRFENAGFFATGSGQVLGSVSDDLHVAIDDMRDPLLEIDADVGGPLGDVLAFVQTAPLIARHLGPGFDRLHSEAGEATTSIDLDLPLLSFGDFTLATTLAIAGGGLRIDGFAPEASEINGTLTIDDTEVSGDGIDAVFLGGPVRATVIPARDEGYRTVVAVTGETTSDEVLAAFALPMRELIDGQTLWSGRLSLPRTESADPGPLAIEIESNLSGVALRFPEPLAKPPGEAVNMQLEFVFDGEKALSITGNLGATRRFEFMLGRHDETYEMSRGAVTFGGMNPVLPLRDGIVVDGRVPELILDDWLVVARTSSIGRARPLFHSAALEVANFEAFGQQLGETSLAVQRGDGIWDIDLASAAIAGRIEVPQDLERRAPIVADMDRVYLAAGERPADPAGLDPRSLPGLRLRAAEFGLGSREFGRVEVDAVADPRGLRLTSFMSATDNYALEASGSWLADGARTTSRIVASVSSSNVAATLDQLGIDPVVEGESGELTASVFWDGPPSSGWLDHLNGDVALSVETGSLIEIDPGAGRVVGLMSIAALPRRLMLDFRDVFNKGFSFDEITGSFTIENGNAYTDNLKLSGPAAEIGVIGRTGLRDRDYQQQAVVTAEPGNMLPTVGGLLGGPGVGAALLIFTRIFKEPLKGIGRASYCVTGGWDDPIVERITVERAEHLDDCVALPQSMADAGNGG